MGSECRNIEALVASSETPSVRRGPIYFFFFSLSPYYPTLNSFFFAEIRVTGRTPGANSELPSPHFSAGERKLKYPGPGFGYNQESAVQIEPIYFLFFSVPPCLRGAKVLSLVAASSRRDSVVQRSCHSTVRLINPTMFGANARIIAGTFSRNGAV